MDNNELEKRLTKLEDEVKSLAIKKDKEIPIKPRHRVTFEMSIPIWTCACCDYELRVGNANEIRYNYCPECGQKIKWEN